MKQLVMMAAVLAGMLAWGAETAAPNTLTAKEKAEGWKLLWDGKTSEGWLRAGGNPFPTKGWEMKDGVLTVYKNRKDENGVNRGGGGDIVTAAKFRDFEFSLDFRLTKGANSGIKYFQDEKLNGGTTLEYQLLDKDHPDWKHGRDGNRRVAALYDMFPAPKALEVVKPVGEWNTARLVSKGNHVEHWLNGVKVLEYERGGEAFMAAFKQSKYADKNTNKNGKWGLTEEGRILIQDHGDSQVSFRNIKIKQL